MPTFHVHVLNREFEASNSVEAPDVERARIYGLRAALQIGTDEVCNGVSFFGAEVRVERDGQVEERMLVGIGSSQLKQRGKADGAAGSSGGGDD